MTEPKDRLKQIRENLGLKQSELAEKTGINPSSIKQIEAGYAKLSVKIALLIKKKVVKTPAGELRLVDEENPQKVNEANLRTVWLLYGDGEPFESTINTHAGQKLSEGIPSINGTKLDLFQKLNNIDNLCSFVCADDSMEPFIQKNDILLIDKNKKDIIDGKTYLIEINGDFFIRLLRKDINVIKLTPVNQSYNTISLSLNEINIIGAVCHILRDVT